MGVEGLQKLIKSTTQAYAKLAMLVGWLFIIKLKSCWDWS